MLGRREKRVEVPRTSIDDFTSPDSKHAIQYHTASATTSFSTISTISEYVKLENGIRSPPEVPSYCQ